MRLPSGYIELDYIEANANQYIRTGISAKYGLKIDTRMMFLSDAYQHFLSMWVNQYDMWYFCRRSSTTLQFMYMTIDGVTSNKWYQFYCDGSYGNQQIYVDGVLKGTADSTSSISSRELYLFVSNDSADGLYLPISARVSYMKIYDGDTLVRDWVSAKRLSDNLCGLYDLANGVFYPSLRGSFVGGNVVNVEENIFLEDNPLNFKASTDILFEANTKVMWNITLDYDETLGQASYEWGQGNNAFLKAIPNDNAQFKGWYYESELISTNLETEVEVNHNTTYRAIFERVYDVNTSVVGLGDVEVTRQTDRNIVVVSVIPHANWSFEKYVVDGDETTQNPLPLSLNGDVNLVAHFVEDEKFHISATTNVPNGTIYISKNDDYDGYESTLYARPIPNYVFDEWDDGNKDNPRNIVVTSNVTYLAKYTKVAESNGIYQYRCFVKDQLDLEAPPKAFMIVDTFTIRTDLMTNAKSTLTVLEMASNVNNGDVVVLYNPKGDVLYQGVVTSIEDLKISCSQMQSYYKGTWIYNVSSKSTLEEEIAVLLQDYADGKMYGSTYIDRLVAQRLGGITIDFVGSTTASLPNDLDDKGEEKYSTQDMEKFIYSLYEDYGIMFDFEINFSGANYVHIKVPNYDAIKVGNNMYAIQNMSPIETIEETNRLIVYSAAHEYRKTFVATKTGIVEEPTSTANRFDITNTKIVFSDDELSDLVANNLPSIMYNHKLTFDLVIKNFIYQFSEFKMGMPLDVWYGSEYFNSVLTGYEMKKTSNQNVTMVSFTCGKVRNSLTQKLTTLGVL